MAPDSKPWRSEAATHSDPAERHRRLLIWSHVRHPRGTTVWRIPGPAHGRRRQRQWAKNLRGSLREPLNKSPLIGETINTW